MALPKWMQAMVGPELIEPEPHDYTAMDEAQGQKPERSALKSGCDDCGAWDIVTADVDGWQSCDRCLAGQGKSAVHIPEGSARFVPEEDEEGGYSAWDKLSCTFTGPSMISREGAWMVCDPLNEMWDNR